MCPVTFTLPAVENEPCSGVSMTTVNGTHVVHEPPQSTSVSVPLRTPSPQLGAWQTLLVQTPLVQSAPVLQPWPGPQSGHTGPPQSMPVSAPSCTPPVQVGCSQTPLVQSPLVQSEPVSQPSPTPQVAQVPPPQSRPVSWSFWTPSAQLGQAVGTPLLSVRRLRPSTERCWILLPDATLYSEHMRWVEPSPAFSTVKTEITPPGPGGSVRSRPPVLLAVTLAVEPARTDALFTPVPPAGANLFRNLAVRASTLCHGAGKGSAARLFGVST